MELITLPRSDLVPHMDSTNSLSDCYTSTPSSPSRTAAIYAHFHENATGEEETPGGLLSKSHHRSNPDIAGVRDKKGGDDDDDDDENSGNGKGNDDDHLGDFAFDFGASSVTGGSGAADSHTATADELFESGRIRPLNPVDLSLFFPRSPTRFFVCPRETDLAVDPSDEEKEEATRGRDSAAVHASGGIRRGGGRRTTRSLPPLGRSGAPDFIELSDSAAATNTNPPIAATVATITEYVKDGIKRWGLRNLLLFRSASEGRASGGRRDTLRKYTGLSPVASTMLSGRSMMPSSSSSSSSSVLALDHGKNESFRSMESDAGSSSSSRRRIRRSSFFKGERQGSSSVGGSSRHASAHEVLYGRRNRAMSEELRRRTFLPYKQGLLGCLAFNPSVDGLVVGLGSLVGHRRS